MSGTTGWILGLGLCTLAVGAHAALTTHLAAHGLLSSLLSPNPRTALEALLAGGAWYALRLGLTFGLPTAAAAIAGWELTARVQAAIARSAQTPAIAPR